MNEETEDRWALELESLATVRRLLGEMKLTGLDRRVSAAQDALANADSGSEAAAILLELIADVRAARSALPEDVKALEEKVSKLLERIAAKRQQEGAR